MSEDDLHEVLFRARLHRLEKDTPWGFRLQGGVEFNKPLTLLKVIPESIAAKVGLNAGDILVRLAGQSAESMTHRDAQQAIVNSGNSLEIIVERADVTCSSSQCIGSTISDKGQIEVTNSTPDKSKDDTQNDFNSSRTTVTVDGLDSTNDSSERLVNKISIENEVLPTQNALNRKGSVDSPNHQPLEQLPPPSALPTPPPSPSISSTSSQASVIPENSVKTKMIPNDVTTTSSVDSSSSSSSSSSVVAASSSSSSSSSSLLGAETDRDAGRLRSESNSHVDRKQDSEAAESGKKVDEEEAKSCASVDAKMAPVIGTVLTDHNDNIPLDAVESQNSFPVRAILTTSALSSEMGDESSEGADDQSSEFSDDISVIEVQTTAATSGGKGATNSGNDEYDEANTGTEALFYQYETEDREISLLNFDERFLEATRSAGSSDADADMNRMRAFFYLPSLMTDSEQQNVTQQGTGNVRSVMTQEGPMDKIPRDFTYTAPWRISKTMASAARSKSEDVSEAVVSQLRPVSKDDSLTQPTVSYIINDPNQQPRIDYSVTENVIYIPISIIEKQLKLGTEYSFQRKTPVSDTSARPQPPVTMTLTGRRGDDRHVIRLEPPVDLSQSATTNIAIVRSSDDGQATRTVATSTASATVTMATAKVYISPIMSQSTGRPTTSGPSEVTGSPSTSEHRRLSSEILLDLQDIPLPAVKDIVADLNSRLEKVAKIHESSSVVGPMASPSTELGTSFGRPERRRSSSGSDSEKEIIIDTPPFDQDTRMRVKESLLRNQPPPGTYRSVIYGGGDISPKSIRRFSLPGGSLNVKDSAQRRVRFAEPLESSVIEIEGRQRHWPTPGHRVTKREDDGHSYEAEYVSVSSLAEKLDRIELENALASAAMKRSRPFQPQVSSLLASHPVHTADIRATSPSRGPALVGRAAWKLEPIQERVINIQTYQTPEQMKRDERQLRIGPQKSAAAASASSGSVRCTSDFGGGFSLSIGPESGGQLSLSLQQHPNHGSRQGYPPTKVNFILPTGGEVGGKPDQFSYSVSTGVAREPIKYSLPPTYEESVRAMAAGRHPRSSSLDDAKPQMPVAHATAAAAAYPPRISELRAESHMTPSNFPQQPVIRMVRAQSPTLQPSPSQPSPSHPAWVITPAPPGQDLGDPRRAGYSQTLQVDTASKQVSSRQSPSSSGYGLPVIHARSGAMTSSDVPGYQQPVGAEGPSADHLLRIMTQPTRIKHGLSSDLQRPDVASRFCRSASPLVLSPTGISNSGSPKPVSGSVRSFSPVTSPSGPDRRWPSHRPDSLGQPPHSPLAGAAPPPPQPQQEPLPEQRRWPTLATLRPLTPTAQQTFVYDQPRHPSQPPTVRLPPEAARGFPQQRMPGIFALLDKTFTDKVLQWERSGRSGGLQQSETYKLVREMDDAMKQNKQ